MERVVVVGSGNWGSCIAKIAGENVARLHAAEPQRWERDVAMWVFEERVAHGGREQNLSDVINAAHENPKYLPGVRLPENVRAVPDLRAAADGATLLVFVLPHQFVARACATVRACVSPGARAISLVKGLDLDAAGGSALGISLVSSAIREALGGIDVAVLMGANLANDVARERFCEATLGGAVAENLAVWTALLQTPYFRLTSVADAAGVELCGALKNVVATAAGLVDGFFARLSPDGSPAGADNTKAAVIRRGLVELARLCALLDPDFNPSTLLESCGVADIVTSSYGGRNRRVAAAFAQAGGARPLDALEAELLGGQKLQGPPTAAVVHSFLAARGMLRRFPVFVGTYRVCYEGAPVTDLFLDPVDD